MIHFVTLLAHRKTHDLLVMELVRREGAAVSLQDYTIWPDRFCRPSDVVILGDFERFQDAEMNRIRGYARRCERLGARVLNKPWRAMRRKQLINSLALTGNGFRAWRASQVPPDIRFPVFLRDEFEHEGSATGLLGGPDALAEALQKFELDKAVDREPLVVEFIDTRPVGNVRYHKYGAFIVEGVVVPRHLFYARDWVVKRPDEQTEEDLAAEREYLRNNQHAKQIADACQAAGIDYGRIDFAGHADGSITVFEINTNPTVFHLDDFVPGPRQWVTETFYAQLARTLRGYSPRVAAPAESL